MIISNGPAQYLCLTTPHEDGIALPMVVEIQVFVDLKDDPNVGLILVRCLSIEESFVDDGFLVTSSPGTCNPVVHFLLRIVRIIVPLLFVLGLLWFPIEPKNKYVYRKHFLNSNELNCFN